MNNPFGLLITLLSLAITADAALLIPLAFPAPGVVPVPMATAVVIIAVLTLLVFAAQWWRVAIRGTRGDVSISMAIDVATMLLLPPYIAAAGSALGTAMYHFVTRSSKEHRLERAFVRGIVTFAAVALGGWLFRTLKSAPGPLIFAQDWWAVGAGIGLRLAIRVLFYPMGMAAFRSEPVVQQLKAEWNRLPLVPFLLTTTLGGSAALIWQEQPYAVVLLLGPLAATWAATGEFRRLNHVLDTLEDTVADRTVRLGETVLALERRLSEFEALNTIGQAMVQVLQPEAVLEVIARESARISGGTSALVTLLSEDGRQFIRAAHGDGMEDYIGTELPIETSLAGLVVRTGEVQISLQPHTDLLLNQNLVRSGKWQSVLEAPLRSKERVLGVLVVATTNAAGFDEQHIRLIALLGNQVGLFLESARLHAKEREVAVLEERNRLARELHDSVTQVLFGLVLNLETVSGLQEKKPERAAELVTRSQEMAAEALAEMRSLIFELRPSALEEKGLATALANHLNLFRRRNGIETDLVLEGEERLSPDLEFCLYRVAQESLHNVVKHARAKHVSISYHVEPGYALLRITDDGVGFDPEAASSGQSFGMLGMHERLAAFGGVVSVVSAPGQGTTITAKVPLS
jgi:signal transduction histidine kinase